MFRGLLITFLLLDLLWWAQARAWLIHAGRGRAWRVALAVFMVAMLSLPGVVLLDWVQHKSFDIALPMVLATICYLWHLLILPITFVAMLAGGGAKLLTWALRRLLATWRTNPIAASRPPAAEISPPPAAPSSTAPSTNVHDARVAPLLSRRRLLSSLAVAAPPFALAATTGVSLWQLGRFRINRTTLAFSGWPRDLDGFTIAIVADIHAGLFTTQRMLQDIRDRTNSLRPDLILLPGDLINYSLGDLPAALDIVRGMSAPGGVYMVTGNHDVVESEKKFCDGVVAAGVNLLHDQAAVIRTPGKTPFTLLGIRWSDTGKDGWDSSIARACWNRRDPSLFPILMAHHPHAWDSIEPFNIPLTISGHTHGGQIMLTKNIGAGPLRFRYWTGLYQRRQADRTSSLLISNGVGNWFPLRINAPPEIVLLTMRTAP